MLGWFCRPIFSVIMPMKRSGDSSPRGDMFFSHALCGSPQITCSDFKDQTHFLQEDDSGIKSGKS